MHWKHGLEGAVNFIHGVKLKFKTRNDITRLWSIRAKGVIGTNGVDAVSFCIILQLVSIEKPTRILLIARGTTPLQRKLNRLPGNGTSAIGGKIAEDQETGLGGEIMYFSIMTVQRGICRESRPILYDKWATAQAPVYIRPKNARGIGGSGREVGVGPRCEGYPEGFVKILWDKGCSDQKQDIPTAQTPGFDLKREIPRAQTLRRDLVNASPQDQAGPGSPEGPDLVSSTHWKTSIQDLRRIAGSPDGPAPPETVHVHLISLFSPLNCNNSAIHACYRSYSIRFLSSAIG
ncbi:hypothetical protein B0H17DRAFT_1147448 [Mycena rosella]|uniref:Uncharacterized protein n=1 Tax=Mycena rosella TaxID=1033263 RepID=A0AAD7CLR4_MYCRO|nr:hypothetical protein B0H17DRAFT_1147448 [Mycena rosella]